MNRILISLQSLVFEYQDGSKLTIPMWLLGGILLSLAGIFLLSVLAVLAMVRRGNQPGDEQQPCAA